MPVLVALVAAVALALAVVAARLNEARHIEGVTVRTPTDDTTIDGRGAVRSVQAADILLPPGMLDELWTAQSLERLARTYWRYLSAVTLGLVRVYYTPGERYVCLLLKSFKLLTFRAPEYEADGDRGIVRWRIARGLLVAPAGREGDGYLEIEVRRLPSGEPERALVNVEVEVANFYPAIANRLGRFLYTNTQSRIHVVVTHGFLHRIAARRLDESVTGRFRG